MAERCSHLDQINAVTPSAEGCEDCLRTGGTWVHLRLCKTCGHGGCCDDSPHKHAPQGDEKRVFQHPANLDLNSATRLTSGMRGAWFMGNAADADPVSQCLGFYGSEMDE